MEDELRINKSLKQIAALQIFLWLLMLGMVVLAAVNKFFGYKFQNFVGYVWPFVWGYTIFCLIFSRCPKCNSRFFGSSRADIAKVYFSQRCSTCGLKLK